MQYASCRLISNGTLCRRMCQEALECCVLKESLRISWNKRGCVAKHSGWFLFVLDDASTKLTHTDQPSVLMVAVPLCISPALRPPLSSLQIFVCGCGALRSLFSPHFFFCAHLNVYEECISEIKTFSHTSLNPVLLFLTSFFFFFHIIEAFFVFLTCI